MKKPNSIQFVLSAKKILSVNALYGAKLMYSGNRPVATMYKKSDAKKMEEYIKEQVKALDIPNNHPWVNKDTKFKFTFTAIFKSGYFMRDLDNCCKNLIDGIFRALGYNDSHICEIHCYKTLCPDIPEEKICIEMAEFTGEARFDKITEDLPNPEKIFLGGTCPEWNGIQWRNELIPELEKNNVNYFNPIVEDWTPECIEIENIEKNEKCDCELYILTPAMQGVYSVAEIINAAYEVSIGGYGCLLVGILGSKEDWGDGMWRSLTATVKMVNEISGGSKRVVASFLESPVDILNYIKKKKRNGKN